MRNFTAYKVCVNLKDGTRISRVIHAPSAESAKAHVAMHYSGQIETITAEAIHDRR